MGASEAREPRLAPRRLRRRRYLTFDVSSAYATRLLTDAPAQVMLRNLALLAASAQGLRRPRAIRALAVRGGGTTTTTTTTTTETSYTKSITADDIARAQKAVSYTHLTLPTKRIV